MGNERSKVDEAGVPVLNANDIEVKAEELITYFDPNILGEACETPLITLIEKLQRDYDINFDLSLDLGISPNGNKILGKTVLRPRGIFIDRSLANNSRLQFVLGHELGHLILHRNIEIEKTGYDDNEIIDTKLDVVTSIKILSTSRDWIEWQANRFSSAILMPRATLHTKLRELQEASGLTRNVGKIVLTHEQYSMRDYKAIERKLCATYNVNSTNINIRLRELQILDDHRKLDVKHISQLFNTE